MATEFSRPSSARLRKRRFLRFFVRCRRLAQHVVIATWLWLDQLIVVSFGSHTLLRVPAWKMLIRIIVFTVTNLRSGSSS